MPGFIIEMHDEETPVSLLTALRRFWAAIFIWS
jgi:hypothetical protein